eukprot:1159166-Pelagomonas_calceolata.AAC.6
MHPHPHLAARTTRSTCMLCPSWAALHARPQLLQAGGRAPGTACSGTTGRESCQARTAHGAVAAAAAAARLRTVPVTAFAAPHHQHQHCHFQLSWLVQGGAEVPPAATVPQPRCPAGMPEGGPVGGGLVRCGTGPAAGQRRA